MKPTRVFDIVSKAAQSHPDYQLNLPPAVSTNKPITIGELAERSETLADRLVHDGVKRMSSVVVWTKTGPERLLFEVASMKVGASVVVLDEDVDADTFIRIFRSFDVRAILLHGEKELSRFKLLLPQLPKLENIYTVEPCDGSVQLASMLTPHSEHKVDADRYITTDDLCLTFVEGRQVAKYTHKQVVNMLGGDIMTNHLIPYGEMYHLCDFSASATIRPKKSHSGIRRLNIFSF